MSDKTVRSHIDISLSILKRFKRALEFDIYVQRSKTSYTKIFLKGDLVDWSRVAQYEEKGISHFYLTAKDYRIFGIILERFGEQVAEDIEQFTPEEGREVLKDLAQFTMFELVERCNIDERIVENAGNVVKGCMEVLAKDPKGILTLLTLLSGQPYILKHSVMVSVFSVLLAKDSGILSDTNLKIVGLGGFLHDIGVGQLSFDPEDTENLTAEQRREMNRHPELGRQALDRVRGIRSEVLQIVMQHHEQPNGNGYPNGLRESEIYHPAKIVTIADSFCSLITKRTYRDAFSVAEAITIMKECHGKYDKNLLDSFTNVVMPRKKSA